MNNYMGINHYVTVYIMFFTLAYVLVYAPIFCIFSHRKSLHSFIAHWISHHQNVDEHKIQILFSAGLCFSFALPRSVHSLILYLLLHVEQKKSNQTIITTNEYETNLYVAEALSSEFWVAAAQWHVFLWCMNQN